MENHEVPYISDEENLKNLTQQPFYNPVKNNLVTKNKTKTFDKSCSSEEEDSKKEYFAEINQPFSFDQTEKSEEEVEKQSVVFPIERHGV